MSPTARAKTTRSQHTRSAIEVAEQCLSDIKNAQLAGGEATSAMAMAEQEIAAAERQHEESLDAQIRGEEGSTERVRAAANRVTLARQQKIAASFGNEAAARVLRQSRARLAHTREAHLEEFASDAEVLTAACAEAAEELEAAMRRYRARWDQASGKWSPLVNAIRRKVEALDSGRGQERDTAKVRDESEMPDCPITDQLLWQVASIAARPRAMSPNFKPGDKPTPPPAPSHTDFTFDANKR
jgi:hypothetical protein